MINWLGWGTNGWGLVESIGWGFRVKNWMIICMVSWWLFNGQLRVQRCITLHGWEWLIDGWCNSPVVSWWVGNGDTHTVERSNLACRLPPKIGCGGISDDGGYKSWDSEKCWFPCKHWRFSIGLEGAPRKTVISVTLPANWTTVPWYFLIFFMVRHYHQPAFWAPSFGHWSWQKWWIYGVGSILAGQMNHH